MYSVRGVGGGNARGSGHPVAAGSLDSSFRCPPSAGVVFCCLGSMLEGLGHSPPMTSYSGWRALVPIIGGRATMGCAALIPVIGTLAGALLGTWLGYFLSTRQDERNFRRIVLRDIAFEYRRLANSGESGGVQGLIRAGIYQCETDRDYDRVLSLVDDLKPKIEPGDDWRPGNGKYVEFFARLRNQGKDPTSAQQLLDLKKEVEGI